MDVVLWNHNAPETCPGSVGSNQTVAVHASPGPSVIPVVHDVRVRKAAFVALWRLTSVNANGASPQFDTLTVADVLLPTGCWPNSSVSALMQMRELANALDDRETTAAAARRAKARSGGMARNADRADYARIDVARIIAASRWSG